MAAVLGKRLALSIAEILSIDKEFIIFWSDSTSVLWWVKGYSREFKPFVLGKYKHLQIPINGDTYPQKKTLLII